MAFDLNSVLQRYMGGNAQPTDNTAQHFDEVAQAAPPAVVSQGISEAFKSDQTPPFGHMVGQLFGNANPNQKSGMLSQLLSGLGPAALGSAAATQLAGLLGQRGVPPQSVTPQQAEQVSPEQVQQIATQAEKTDPSIVDKMSGFYAEHPGLVKTLGGAALTIALAKIAQGMK